MTGSKLRVVGSGRRARGDEAKRHDEAISQAGELLTLAESFERQPEPDRSEGEDSNPQISTDAESAEPDADIAAAPQVIQIIEKKGDTDLIIKLDDSTYKVMVGDHVEVLPDQDSLEERMRADLKRYFAKVQPANLSEMRLHKARFLTTSPARRKWMRRLALLKASQHYGIKIERADRADPI